MGKNPNRTAENQTYHDDILKVLASDMQVRGYNVKADHIDWPNGLPQEVYGHVPDVIATSGSNGNFIMEVEDCTSYSDEHTKEQLKSFVRAQGYICYIIIPSTCNRQGKPYDTSADIKIVLNIWGLTNVKIGLYDWNSKKITYCD